MAASFVCSCSACTLHRQAAAGSCELLRHHAVRFQNSDGAVQDCEGGDAGGHEEGHENGSDEGNESHEDDWGQDNESHEGDWGHDYPEGPFGTELFLD